jgi:hypothetical protein
VPHRPVRDGAYDARMRRQPEVEAWFDAYEKSMKPVAQRVREVVLEVRRADR